MKYALILSICLAACGLEAGTEAYPEDADAGTDAAPDTSRLYLDIIAPEWRAPAAEDAGPDVVCPVRCPKQHKRKCH